MILSAPVCCDSAGAVLQLTAGGEYEMGAQPGRALTQPKRNARIPRLRDPAQFPTHDKNAPAMATSILIWACSIQGMWHSFSCRAVCVLQPQAIVELGRVQGFTHRGDGIKKHVSGL